MFNNKGTTLIEGLLAFEIFITVLVVYTTLFTTLYQREYIIQNKYESLIQKEDDLIYINDLNEIIKQVLP
ncbi:MAG: hypothetical protein LUF02_04075 [Erysipelotrichaceae bacterium]|nr:hypothetical protein [Erysipelotrichaceae bacterium]